MKTNLQTYKGNGYLIAGVLSFAAMVFFTATAFFAVLIAAHV